MAFYSVSSAVLLLLSVSNAVQENRSPFKSAQEWINIVNSNPESTWTAGQNFDSDVPSSYVNKLLGVKSPDEGSPKLEVRPFMTELEYFQHHHAPHIPKFFDARKKWKHCNALRKIRDQGNCGSCWAVSTASAFADRLCISSKGKWNFDISSTQLLSCCAYCISDSGCDGGAPDAAWIFIKQKGLVTGGDYNNHKGCQPYPISPCEHHIEGPRPNCSAMGDMHTPACETRCTNSHYTRPYESDFKKAKRVYLVPFDVKEIQKEIITHGPVVAQMEVYEDFFSYKSGVYQRTPGSVKTGNHAIKLIGWGEANGVPYWLVQNSWNSDWGDKGLFKIRRGVNECAFEQRITAGIPRHHRSLLDNVDVNVDVDI